MTAYFSFLSDIKKQILLMICMLYNEIERRKHKTELDVFFSRSHEILISNALKETCFYLASLFLERGGGMEGLVRPISIFRA